MKNLKIKDIVKATKGELIVGNKEAICKKYSKDTRTIKSGDCYIGIKGESFDGNLFWEKALENGAELSTDEFIACKNMFRKFIDFCCDEGIIEDEDGELDDRLEEFFDGLNRK